MTRKIGQMLSQLYDFPFYFATFFAEVLMEIVRSLEHLWKQKSILT